jgi:circadian clock protein KaiC
MSEADVIKTGIDGLDTIFQGGIPRSNTILVQGVAGTGKTLMGIEFIFQGISQYDEPGLIVVFETSPDKLVRDAAQFGWNLDELQAQHKLKIIFTSPHVLESELRSPNSLLLQTAAEMGARRIFIDGIGLLSPAIPDGGHSPLSGPGSYRELLLQLMEGLQRQNLTAMLSHETGSREQSLATLESAGFLADTLIELTLNRQSRSGQRGIEIIKSRGQEYISGPHTLRITSKKGLEVFPRAQAPVNRTWGQPTSNTKGSVAGVQTLDDLIGGGLFDGSTTMVIGISGVGKTVLATQLLREGIVNEGKRGLLVSLDEHPAQIIRNSHTLGFDLQKHLDSGMLRVFYESPQELEIDSHFARIVKTVEDNDIQRMVIDGVTSYSTALNDHRRYRDFFHAVVAYSKSRLMTTVFTYENAELFGISSYMPEFPVSSIVDNIILMSLVEFGSTLHRCMAVVKARGCKHEFDTREFVIGEGGISLLHMDKSAELPALPIESYSSILSRAPTRTGVARGTARAAKGGK